MDTKQYSVKVFEVNLTEDDNFISFFEAKYAFFKNHLIVLNGHVTPEVKDYLNEKQMKYVVNVELPKRKATSVTEPNVEVENIKQEIKEPVKEVKPKENLKVLDSLVRSGQELNINGDLLLLNKVNSGGKINIEGNLIITQIVNGSIRCNGDFMMINASPKANIVFHNVEVDNSYLKERLNRVELINNEIVITPVLKEINWA